jgi:glycosyltransferase involved in cell wall biosynthesis
MELVKKRIKVAITTIYAPECPTIQSRLYPFCRLLAEKGFDFTFFVLGKNDRIVCHGITYKAYRNYLDLIKKTIAINKNDFDIIIACKPYSITGLLSYLISKIKKLGYLLDIDDRTFPSEIIKWRRLPLYLQEWLVERFMILLKPHTSVASKALAECWGKHTLYIPNSADIGFFSRKKWASNTIKNKFGIDGRVVIWPAVFFQEIDRYYPIEIFDKISKKRNDIFLLVLGSGEYLPDIQNSVKSCGIENIIFGGQITHSEMPDYYASAHAGLLPLRNNHYDACKGPIKLYEYMAMELPVIATPIGEAKDILEKAECGIIIPFNNADKAANIILNMLESDSEIRRLGANGRAYLERYQSLEMQAEKLGNILNSISKRVKGA